MTGVKTFKIKTKFNKVENLYEYLFNNISVIEQLTGLKIQKNLKRHPFCIIGLEEITQRQILLFASGQDFLESFGKLIVLAGTYNADIIIFFLPKNNQKYLMPINWLQKICAEDYEFFVGQVKL